MDDETEKTAEHPAAGARPCPRPVHAGEAMGDDREPLPAAVTKTPADKKSPAEWAYQRLILYIKNFEKTLDNEHEIAMGFTDTGAGVLRIQGLGYFDPDVVTFFGTDQTGARVQLVQHVTQLNVLLRAMPKADSTAAPRRIGFELARALEETDDA